MIPEIVAGAAASFGERTAFVTAEGWPLSCAELHRLSDEVAAGLTARGTGPGDVVVLSLPSTIDYVVAYVAIAKVGAITAGLNPSLAPPERIRLVEIAGPKLVLTSAALADGVPSDAPVETIVPGQDVASVLRELREPGAAPAELPADPDRPVAIVFTSGTTGTPKGAVFTVRQLEAIRALDSGDRWDGGGHQLASTQFAHVGFMTKLPWYVAMGTTTHLLPRWRAAEVLHLIAEHRMPTVAAVAPQVALLLRVADFDELDLTCVQSIVAGAGPSPPGLVREARERFNAPYSIRYSSTECGGVGTLTALDAPDEEALYTVGRPRPGIDLEIRDEAGAAVPVGEPGEVCLRSGAVMSGYWRDPEATAVALRDGWLHTGDLGRIDEQGCLRLVGRSKEMFIRGGYNVFPMEVESVLSAHPSVSEVAIVPRPDPVMGEIGVAVVVPRDAAAPPSLEDLRAFATGQLATWKLPEDLRVVEALPLTAMQKLDRRALAADEAGTSSTP